MKRFEVSSIFENRTVYTEDPETAARVMINTDEGEYLADPVEMLNGDLHFDVFDQDGVAFTSVTVKGGDDE
jgi:hypothetical protein